MNIDSLRDDGLKYVSRCLTIESLSKVHSSWIQAFANQMIRDAQSDFPGREFDSFAKLVKAVGEDYYWECFNDTFLG